MLKNLVCLLKAIPHSYATVMFSDNLGVGIALLGLTFVSPIIGLSGLIGLLCALLLSRLLGYEAWDSSSGVMAFNSLLISLAIAYYYPYSSSGMWSVPFIGLILVASTTTLFLYAALNYLTQTLFKMPSLSLAFCIAGILFWFYMVRSGYFVGTNFAKPILFGSELNLPWFWRDYFLSLGSVMFVPNVWVGILVAGVLLFITRIGSLLALIGWSVGWLLLQHANMGSTYGMFFPGFNLILISIAVGSVFLIPSKSAYLMAIIATVIGFILAYALSGRFYYSASMMNRPSFLYLPIFALPMNIVVIGLIYALRLRIKQSSPVINDYGILHPEKALDAYLSRYRRFTQTGVPQIHLPISGEWTITQGHNGEHTHKRDWALAWDFEMEDLKGAKYSGDAGQLKDYYSFGKQVFAAAAGYVAKVVNGIPDNPIGSLNTQDNWGNYVSINHGYGFFTLYAHLKEGSIKLGEGDYIKQGDKVGHVGNSGRSPVPHLHFHAQLGVDAGSKTIFSHIINYKVRNDCGAFEFISSGVPRQGQQISPLVEEKNLASLLQLSYGQEQRFQVQSGGKSWNETWKVDLDLLGNHSIISDRHTKVEFSIFNGIYNSLSLAHHRKSALAALAIGLSRLPWVENQSLEFDDEPSLSVVMNPLWKNVTLFLMPFFKPIRAFTHAKLVSAKNETTVSSETELSVLGLKFSSYHTEVVIDHKHGISSIELRQGANNLLSASSDPGNKEQANV